MVGIISNSAALFAQRNLDVASRESELSIARLSSGQAIIRASDDVSGLAIGTVLSTTVSTLKTVLTSTSQANSLLSIADGGLKNVSDILQRQKSLAVSSLSGSLSDNERAFLNEEFQNLVAEIDRLVDGTEFNGIKLLNGGISGAAGLTTATSDATGNYSLNALGDFSISENTDPLNTYTRTMIEATSVATAVTFAVAQDGGTFETNVTTIATIPTAGTAESIAIDFSAGGGSEDFNSGDSFSINGVTFTIGAGTATAGIGSNAVTIGEDSTEAEFAQSIASGINAAAGTAATAVYSGDTVTITATAVGNTGLFDPLATAAANPGGLQNSIGALSAVVTDGTAADTIEVNGNIFTFVAQGEVTTGQNIALGGTLAATLDNIVLHLNDESVGGGSTVTAGAGQAVSDFTYTTNGSSTLTATADMAADAAAAVGDPADFTGGTIGAAFQAHSVGIASAPVGTPTYQSTLQGAITDISSNFLAADANNNARVQLSATVGGVTYLSNLLDLGTTPTVVGDSVFTFTSQASTGSTDITFSINIDDDGGFVPPSVANQTEANTFANNLQSDLDGSGFTINQSRVITSFTEASTDGTALQGLRAQDVIIKADGFDTVGGFGSMDSFDVDRTANTISTTIGGVTYSALLTGTGLDTTAGGSYASGIITTGSAGSAAVIVLTSADLTDGREIRIDLDQTASGFISFDTAEGEAALEGVLNSAFAIGAGSSLTFQVGTKASDSIGVSVGSAKTADIYKDSNNTSVILSIATAGATGSENGGDGTGSVLAGNVIDRALNTVTSLRATVGALQSRFDFAAANITSSIQNTEAARSEFLDVNIASESTAFATSQVRLQASISVLAQANQIPQNLLKLIG